MRKKTIINKVFLMLVQRLKCNEKNNKRLFSLFTIIIVIVIFTGCEINSKKEGNSFDLQNPEWNKDVVTWDCIWFGHYWQGDTDGDGYANQKDKKQPIKWRILSIHGDDALILSDKNLDLQVYNEEEIPMTWGKSQLRKWLNSDFYNNAFNDSEKTAIKDSNIVNEDNPYFGTKGGNDTIDKVFLPSISEIRNYKYGFKKTRYPIKARIAINTLYVIGKGGDGNTDREYSGNWWLRSPSDKDTGAADIQSIGSIGYMRNINNTRNGVRPAIHISLSSSVWKKAGQVNSEEVNEMIIKNGWKHHYE